jgi:hypothetical protein
VLTATVDQLLTNPSTGVMATELVPAAAAFKLMKRANGGLTWVKQKHVTAFLNQLAVDQPRQPRSATRLEDP